jgi:hypothetical protein
LPTEKNKGVKVFQLSVGDLVLRKVMKNISRKGGKLDALWTGMITLNDENNNFMRMKFYLWHGIRITSKILFEISVECKTYQKL